MISEKCLCPLYPFDSDCKDIALIGGIHIMPAPDSFKKLLYDRCSGIDTFWDEGVKIDGAWVAELPYLDKTIDELQDTISREEFSTLELLSDMFAMKTEILAYCFVTALRLYKEGLVTPGPIAVPMAKSQEPMWLTPDWLHISSDDYAFEEPKKYTLLQTDIPEINKIFVDVLRWKISQKYKNIEVALNRFHSAYSGEPEEKIVDQMIAFEAIYLGDAQELKYKLSMRTAFFIGEPRERERIHKDMLKAYNLRNSIIHGSNKPVGESVDEILPKTENYLRQSMRKILSSLPEVPQSNERRQQWFDDKILNWDNFSL